AFRDSASSRLRRRLQALFRRPAPCSGCVPPLLPLARRALLAGLIPYALTVSLGSALAGGAVATARVVLLGRSIEGRPIDASKSGTRTARGRSLVLVASTGTNLRGSRSRGDSNKARHAGSTSGSSLTSIPTAVSRIPVATPAASTSIAISRGGGGG